MSVNHAGQCLSLAVAGLVLTLDARQTSLTLKLPDSCHESFLVNQTAEANRASAVSNLLVLSIKDICTLPQLPNSQPICHSDFFTLFLEPEGDLIFFAERERLPYILKIDPAFSQGTIEGRFSQAEQKVLYPLQTMGIIVYANWLAQFGDLVLHAAGIANDGKGYAFVGSAGAGKSTLMEFMLKQDSVLVLGEDQVILRYLDGRFWIFGTPWHERPHMCTPIGFPLEKLFFLDRNQDEVCTAMTAADGIKRLMQTAFIPYYRTDRIPKILDRLALLAECLPFYSLAYRLGTDVLPGILKA